MLLRLVVCLGMVGFCIWQGIQASMPTAMVRILYSACAILLLSGLNPRGLITWPIAGLLLLSRGHWIVGWIPIALVVFNLIGNGIKGSITGKGGSSMSNCSDMVLRGFKAVNTKCLNHLRNEDEKSRLTGLIASTMFVALSLKILEEYDLPHVQKDVMQTMEAYYTSVIPVKLSQDKSKDKVLLDMTLSIQKRMPSIGESALPGFMLGALGGTSSPLCKTVDDILQHAQEINVKAVSMS